MNGNGPDAPDAGGTPSSPPPKGTNTPPGGATPAGGSGTPGDAQREVLLREVWNRLDEQREAIRRAQDAIEAGNYVKSGSWVYIAHVAGTQAWAAMQVADLWIRRNLR